MRVGVQFSGDVPAGTSKRWFTHSWPQQWHVAWNVVPVSPQPGNPELEWIVDVERANASNITYWITVRNLTQQPINIEARYAVMN